MLRVKMGRALRLNLPLRSCLGVKFDCIDDEAFVRAFGNFIDAIFGFDVEAELASLDILQPDFDGHRQARRGSSEVGEIHVGADSLLARPVQMRVDGLDTGPFAESDHESGGEDFRHLLEFRRFGKQLRYCFGCGYGEPEFVGQAGL